MWKLAALIAAIVLACLPFTILGFLFFGPMFIASLADRFCRG